MDLWTQIHWTCNSTVLKRSFMSPLKILGLEITNLLAAVKFWAGSGCLDKLCQHKERNDTEHMRFEIC